MKKKYIIALSAFFITTIGLNAQVLKMGDTWSNRELSTKSLGQNDWYYLQQADISFQQFDEQETLFALNNAVAQNPFSAVAFAKRAKFKYQIGMVTEAEMDIALANRLNPYATDLYGVINPRSVKKVLALNPEKSMTTLPFNKELSYYYNFLDEAYQSEEYTIKELTLIESTILYLEKEDLDRAGKVLDSLILIKKSSAIAYDLKGLIAYRNNDLEKARLNFSKAVKLQPDFANAWYNYSRVERATGNDLLALEYLNNSIALEEDLTKAYFDRALLRKKRGEKKLAIEDYNVIIAQGNSDYLEAYQNRGLTKKMLGDFNGALQDLDAVIENDPKNAQAYKNRGNVFLIFGYYNKAIEDYSIAAEIDPEFAEAYYNRGLAHLIRLDHISGCLDLERSAALGMKEAEDKLGYFCVD